MSEELKNQLIEHARRAFVMRPYTLFNKVGFKSAIVPSPILGEFYQNPLSVLYVLLLDFDRPLFLFKRPAGLSQTFHGVVIPDSQLSVVPADFKIKSNMTQLKKGMEDEEKMMLHIPAEDEKLFFLPQAYLKKLGVAEELARISEQKTVMEAGKINDDVFLQWTSLINVHALKNVGVPINENGVPDKKAWPIESVGSALMEASVTTPIESESGEISVDDGAVADISQEERDAVNSEQERLLIEWVKKSLGQRRKTPDAKPVEKAPEAIATTSTAPQADRELQAVYDHGLSQFVCDIDPA